MLNMDFDLLRYESSGFFDQATQAGSAGVCGNQTVSGATAFNAAVESMLSDLQTATPKVNGYFAATNKQVIGGTGNATTVYGVAQCVETITKTGCEDCLQVAYENLQGCLPDADGRAVDVGCFLRYSATPFFADNQTTNLTPFLSSGKSSSSNKHFQVNIN